MFEPEDEDFQSTRVEVLHWCRESDLDVNWLQNWHMATCCFGLCTTYTDLFTLEFLRHPLHVHPLRQRAVLHEVSSIPCHYLFIYFQFFRLFLAQSGGLMVEAVASVENVKPPVVVFFTPGLYK